MIFHTERFSFISIYNIDFIHIKEENLRYFSLMQCTCHSVSNLMKGFCNSFNLLYDIYTLYTVNNEHIICFSILQIFKLITSIFKKVLVVAGNIFIYAKDYYITRRANMIFCTVCLCKFLSQIKGNF